MTNRESSQPKNMPKEKVSDQTSCARIHLTPKEQEVVALLAKGHSYLEISTLLSISENTLKTHIKRIYKKLNVHNRTQAVLAVQKIKQTPSI